MNLRRISADPMSRHDESSQEYQWMRGNAYVEFRKFTAQDRPYSRFG